MLQERQKQLLLLLLENRDQFLSSQELAKRLACSDRTIQSDMQILKEVFAHDRFLFHSKAGQGYRIELQKDLSLEEVKQMLQWIHEGDEEKEAVAFIICTLLLARDFITRDEIIDKLYISEGKLDDLICLAKQDLKQSQIRLEAISGQGFQIQAPQLFKRYALVYYASQIHTSQKKKLHSFLGPYQKIYEQRDQRSIEKILEEEGIVLKTSQKEIFESYLVISIANQVKLKQADRMQYYLYEAKFQKAADRIAKQIFDEDPLESEYLLITLSLMTAKTKQKVEPNHLISYRLHQKMHQFLKKSKPLFLSEEGFKARLYEASLHIYAQNIVAYRSLEKDHLYQTKDLEYLFSERLAATYALSLEAEGISRFYAEDIALLARIFNLELREDLFQKKTKLAILYDEKEDNARYLARKLQKDKPYEIQLLDKRKISEMKMSADFFISEEPEMIEDESLLSFPSLLQFHNIHHILSYKIEEKERKNSLFHDFKEGQFHFDSKQADWPNLIQSFLKIDASEFERLRALLKRQAMHYALLRPQGIRILVFEDAQIHKPEGLVLQHLQGIQLYQERLHLLFLFRIPKLSCLKEIVAFEYQLIEKEEEAESLIKSENQQEFEAILQSFF